MNTMSILLAANSWDFPEAIDEFTGFVSAILLMGLPIVIAILVYRRKVNETNKRTQVLMTALEKNAGVIPEELMKNLSNLQKSIKEKLLGKLLWGILFSLAGLGLVIAVIVEYRTEVDCEFDADFLAIGLILIAVGVAFLVYYFVGCRALQKEIEAEEKEKSV